MDITEGSVLEPGFTTVSLQPDRLRRKVGLSSLQAKLETIELMSRRALNSLNEATFDQERFEQCEAVYASCEEAARTIALAQKLCIRLSSDNEIPRLAQFEEARSDSDTSASS